MRHGYHLNSYNHTAAEAQLHVPNYFPSVHHAGFATPWSIVIFLVFPLCGVAAFAAIH